MITNTFSGKTYYGHNMIAKPPYKSPSMLKITRTQEPIPDIVELGSLKRGDCFLREGSLCMIVENKLLSDTLESCVAIINLGTGRVWCVPKIERQEKVAEVQVTYRT